MWIFHPYSPYTRRFTKGFRPCCTLLYTFIAYVSVLKAEEEDANSYQLPDKWIPGDTYGYVWVSKDTRGQQRTWDTSNPHSEHEYWTTDKTVDQTGSFIETANNSFHTTSPELRTQSSDSVSFLKAKEKHVTSYQQPDNRTSGDTFDYYPLSGDTQEQQNTWKVRDTRSHPEYRKTDDLHGHRIHINITADSTLYTTNQNTTDIFRTQSIDSTHKNPSYTSVVHKLYNSGHASCVTLSPFAKSASFSISNPSSCYKNKCFFVVKHSPFYMKKGDTICKLNNGSVATMKTKGEWNAYSAMLTYHEERNMVVVGMTTYNPSMPDIYFRTVKWIDNTVSYEMNVTDFREYSFEEDNEMYLFGSNKELFIHYQFSRLFMEHVMCQIVLEETETDLSFSNLKLSAVNASIIWEKSKHNHLHLILCPAGHVTHHFQSCDPGDYCLKGKRVLECQLTHSEMTQDEINDEISTSNVSVKMFVCDNQKDTLHYTQVCDFRADCSDRSDEAFCQHHNGCKGFTCTSRQCVETGKRCDYVRNCADGSDEENCTYSNDNVIAQRLLRLPPPAVINFQYGGLFTGTSMNMSDSCPETHFRCPGESNYCLPVFVRCNGVYDCAGREDEAGCSDYACPGFYRCRASRVCVHGDHVCDGLPHCPKHDDELFCGSTPCPEGCRCQGQAFVCRRPFPAHSFPDLRYLDAAGSHIFLSQLSNNSYLTWLSLASCNIAYLEETLFFPNLQTLDLAHNQLTFVSLDVFIQLQNLRWLSLKGNPIVSLESERSNTMQSRLVTFNAPYIDLRVFDSRTLAGFTHLQCLNLSFSKIHTITSDGFTFLPALTRLDISGNPLRDYPNDLFKRQQHLQRIHAGNYRLCCPVILPTGFDENFCFAPEDELSSCMDLLRSDIFRVFLWAISVISVLGNAGCVLVRLCVPTSRHSGYVVFVKSLSVADLLMGVYLAFIGAADAMYRGDYTWHEKQWTGSALCKIAGALSLFSSEVSAFTICLITLDRFIVLRFPFTNFRFHRKSAILACLLAWTLGGALAALPFLPVSSHWEFYGQTGICIPLPVTRKDFAGWRYAFGVMIVVNFALFLLIAAGQAIIYMSILANALSTDTSKRSQELTIARRLITVALSDFFCWFPIGLLGLMAASGIPVPGSVSVGLAIFVLPLNSALNPFLYTYNVIAEKRRKAYEKRLMKILESQLPCEDNIEDLPETIK